MVVVFVVVIVVVVVFAVVVVKVVAAVVVVAMACVVVVWLAAEVDVLSFDQKITLLNVAIKFSSTFWESITFSNCC